MTTGEHKHALHRQPRWPLWRAATAALFVVASVAAWIWHTGWGTASSFGWEAIATICPVGALEVLAADITSAPRVAMALVVVVLITVVLGRAFCGWLCPVPWLQKIKSLFGVRRTPGQAASAQAIAKGVAISAPLSKKCTARSCSGHCAGCAARTAAEQKPQAAASAKGPFVILGAAVASSAVFGFPVFCLICPVGLTFALIGALMSLVLYNDLSGSIVFFAVVLVLEVWLFRRWCSSFCPIGAVLTLVSRFNRFWRPVVEPHCVQKALGQPCTRCRDACPEGIDPVHPTPESMARCTKCGACTQACLASALKMRFVARPAAAHKPVAMRIAINEHGVVPLTRQEVELEIERCHHCGECEQACPQASPMPEVLSLVQRGDKARAVQLLMGPGRLPEICGYVCPSAQLCQAQCSRGMHDEPVHIAALERTLAEEALQEGFRARVRRCAKSVRVAIVGSGPAGLACADVLARSGVAVTIYERDSVAGGLLATAVPSFKLPRAVVANRVALLQSIGVTFKLNTNVGVDVSYQVLMAQYDALFVATGAGKAVPWMLRSKPVVSDRVIDALTYLRAPERFAEAMQASRVVVLGGGDTAVDCARSALRAAPSSVCMVARKPREQLRANPVDLAAALQEGLVLHAGYEVREFSASHLVSLQNAQQAFNLPADWVIVAYGQRLEPQAELQDLGFALNAQSSAWTASERVAPGIWIGGDAARGASLVAHAIADGRRAAVCIAHAAGIVVDV